MDRKEVIEAIFDRIKGETYLEIGVDQGDIFLSVNSEIKIGIDPKPPNDRIRAVLDGNSIRYFEMTSDKFFNKHRNIFDELKVNVALVDGLHEYKQTLRDVENCLKYLSKKGVVVMHDCNPSSKMCATPPNFFLRHRQILKYVENWFRPPNKKGCIVEPDHIHPSEISIAHPRLHVRLFRKIIGLSGTCRWSGDVWKTIVHLRSYHDDLNIFVLDCDCGLGIITRGKPERKLNYSAKIIRGMTYHDLDKNREEILNLKKPEYLHEFLQRFEEGEHEGS